MLVCRVPQSYAAPHRVRATHRFHARESAGKYDMDTAQLRAASPRPLRQPCVETLGRVAIPSFRSQAEVITFLRVGRVGYDLTPGVANVHASLAYRCRRRLCASADNAIQRF